MWKYCLLLLFFPLILNSQNSFKEAVDNFENKEFTIAESQFESIVKKTPNNFKAQEYLGDTYAAQKKWDKAIEVFGYLVNKEPNNANLNYKYGGSLGLKAKNSNKFTALFLLDDIKKYLSKAADLDSSHVEVRWALIELYLELPEIVGGSISKAKKYATELQAISPVDGALANGRIADFKEDFQSAEKHYKNAVEIGGSIVCYKKLINLYVKYQKPIKALDTTKEAIEKLKRNDLKYRYAEIALTTRTKIDIGLEYVDSFITNYDSSTHSIVQALILKAKLHSALNQINEAKKCLKQALALKPDSIQAKTELKRIEQL